MHWGKNIVYRIPLCKNGPGNVGWLDWTPPSGGTSELTDAIIPPAYSPSIDLPSWQFVTETGNVNAAQVETALRTWDGQVVLIPIFDSTCDDTPDGPGCRATARRPTGGNGQNQWYHLPEIAAFQLCDLTVSDCGSFAHGAYVNGQQQAHLRGRRKRRNLLLWSASSWTSSSRALSVTSVRPERPQRDHRGPAHQVVGTLCGGQAPRSRGRGSGVSGRPGRCPCAPPPGRKHPPDLTRRAMHARTD